MRRTMLAGVLVLGIGALAAVAQQNNNPFKQLEGNWTVVAGQENGQALPAERIKGTRVAITAITITVESGKTRRVMTYKMDSTKSPKTIDMIETEGPEKDKSALGIFALEGDTLQLAYGLPGRERPKDFTTKADSGQLSFVMKRVNR
jgi:uncharacterized protein (TIGR03067 family)